MQTPHWKCEHWDSIVPTVKSGVNEETDQVLLVNWILRTFGEDVAECFHHSPNGVTA